MMALLSAGAMDESPRPPVAWPGHSRVASLRTIRSLVDRGLVRWVAPRTGKPGTVVDGNVVCGWTITEDGVAAYRRQLGGSKK